MKKRIFIALFLSLVFVWNANAADFTKSESIVKTVGAQSVKEAIEINEDNLDDLITDYNTNVTKNDATDVSAKSWVLDEDDMASDDATKLATQQSIKAYIDAAVAAVEVEPVGTVKVFGGTVANIPTGYLHCNGQAVSRTTYSDLFAAIGTTWGVGDGSTTFNLPPSGKVLFGADGDSGGSYDTGDTGGSLTIAEANMPAHTHGDGTLATASDGAHTHTIPSVSGTGSSVASFVKVTTQAATTPVSTASNGNHTHNITGNTGSTGSGTDYHQPYAAMPLIIKY